jgi:hypothetical protein
MMRGKITPRKIMPKRGGAVNAIKHLTKGDVCVEAGGISYVKVHTIVFRFLTATEAMVFSSAAHTPGINIETGVLPNALSNEFICINNTYIIECFQL